MCEGSQKWEPFAISAISSKNTAIFCYTYYMTTYVLHGGKTSKPHEGNEYFFSQFTKLPKSKTVTILLCYFSRERSTWESLIERDTTTIRKNSEKSVKILVAENPSDLFQKLEKSDVLYVAGGDAEPIEALYPQLTDLKVKLEGKVYAGSSMGAFLASESYVLSMSDQAENEVHTGVGLLPIQTLCHWNVEEHKDRKVGLLIDHSDTPIIVLNEFETVVIYK